MKRLAAWWKRRKKPGRGWRIARNLLVTGLIAYVFWGLADYPLPTAEMEFRRLEKQQLLPRGGIVFSAVPSLFSSNGFVEISSDKGIAGSVRFSTCFVSVYRNMVGIGEDNLLFLYPLGDGPEPVPVPHAMAGWETDIFGWTAPLLFLDMPEETASAEVELDEFTYREHTYTRSSRGMGLENNVWLFGIKPPETGWDNDWLAGVSYTLRAYREDGSLLQVWEGVIPKSV